MKHKKPKWTKEDIEIYELFSSMGREELIAYTIYALSEVKRRGLGPKLGKVLLAVIDAEYRGECLDIKDIPHH